MNGKFFRAFGIYPNPFFNDGISPESSEEISVCLFVLLVKVSSFKERESRNDKWRSD